MSLETHIHHHVLFLVRASMYTCNICGQQRQNEMFRRCEPCNFNVCPICYELRAAKGYSVSRASQRAAQEVNQEPIHPLYNQQYHAPMAPPMTQSFRYEHPVQHAFTIPDQPPFHYPDYVPHPLPPQPPVDPHKSMRPPSFPAANSQIINRSVNLGYVYPVQTIQPIRPMNISYILY